MFAPIMRIRQAILERVSRIDSVVQRIEAWGVLLGVAGLLVGVVGYFGEREARKDDRINRAVSQLASGYGRTSAMTILSDYSVDTVALKAENAHVSDAVLGDFDLSHSDFRGSFFRNVSFSSVDLSFARFEDLKAEGLRIGYLSAVATSFRGSTLDGINFGCVMSREIDFSNSDIESLSLLRGNFQSASFAGATIRSSYFMNSGLAGANFQGARLFDVNFSGSGLAAADFSNAVFERRRGIMAGLGVMPDKSVNFTDAYLIDATIDGNLLEGALLCNTTLPDGAISDRDCDTPGPERLDLTDGINATEKLILDGNRLLSERSFPETAETCQTSELFADLIYPHFPDFALQIRDRSR
ncbi:hypothetical protein OCH239_10470 [Roseivivax halodurans JCM 10272]|uniref:Pentapeptide repeat-containing protein n=1 Tax=Roseivivax halodurans JCM 10272 TaxID=1449350 RepID=X7EBW3_9RHOB|nr:pentapeptide repeat-containing protein [Roseivivax halodurans]ETX13397.1 hypothetical protein OCH239_10470 [Roseivivax halodurans JCM 10272]